MKDMMPMGKCTFPNCANAVYDRTMNYCLMHNSVGEVRVTTRPLPMHCCRHHCLCGSNPNPKMKCCCAPIDNNAC